MDENLNKDLDENLAWLIQKTEDPKKVATPYFHINPHSFQVHPPLF